MMVKLPFITNPLSQCIKDAITKTHSAESADRSKKNIKIRNLQGLEAGEEGIRSDSDDERHSDTLINH